MFSLCRLCGDSKDAIELNTSISELASKLVLCCDWNQSENGSQMPNKVCNLCVEELQRSWLFAEKVKATEEKLGKLVNAINKTVDESVTYDEITISETIKQEPDDYLIDIDEDEYSPVDAAFSLTVNTNERPHSRKDSTPNFTLNPQINSDNESNLTLTRFFDQLDVEDCLPKGNISEMGLIKLNKVFPEKFSWNNCQYKCDKCHIKFKGPHSFVEHYRQKHTGTADWIDLICFYCDSKHKYEDDLNRHIATEHFSHLKYR